MLYFCDSLQAIYDRHSHGTDKGTIHSYIEVYERILAPFRLDAERILEIGIFEGFSLRMWRDYFLNAEIIGIDVHPRQYDCATCLCGDSRDPRTVVEVQPLDIVIDDGDHASQSQLDTFYAIWPKLRPGGLYIIEDIQNIERVSDMFLALDDSAKIYDLRHIKNRWDDVLITYIKES